MLHNTVALALVSVSSAPVLAGPADLFSEKVKDFGTSPRGTVLIHHFRFTNTTDQTLTLGAPRVSCGCTSASASKDRVGPGETAAIIAHMDTRRIATPNATKSVTIFVPFGEPAREEVALRVQTVCRDDLMMSPDMLAFGTVRAGQGGTVSTKVTFTSDSDWKVTESATTSRYLGVQHKLESRTGGLVTYEITATLNKDCPAGNWTADVRLKTSNADVATLRIPVTVRVADPVAMNPGSDRPRDRSGESPVEKRSAPKPEAPFRVIGGFSRKEPE